MTNFFDVIEQKNVSITIDADELMKFFDAVSKRVTVPEPEDKLLTTEEACQMAKVSRPTLHRWKKAGIIPHIKIGKSVRYKHSDLMKVLKTGKGGQR